VRRHREPNEPKDFSSAWTRKLTRKRPRGLKAAGRERVRIRAVLTCVKQARRFASIATAASRDPRSRKLGRSRRHHRRAIHRRAWHAVERCGRSTSAHGGAGCSRFRNQGQHDGVIVTTSCATIELEDRQQHRPQQDGSRFRSPVRKTAELEITISSSARSSSFKDGSKIKKRRDFVQWDPYNVPILSEKAGKVKFQRHHRRRER